MSTNKKSAILKNLKPEIENLDVEPMQSPFIDKPQSTQRFDNQNPITVVTKTPLPEFFNPTREMVQARIRLTACLTTQQIAASHINDIPNMGKFIYPVQTSTLLEWANIPGFWTWFVGADEIDAELYMLRRRAFSTVHTVMDLPEIDENGDPILKNLSLKMQTSRFIMNETTPKTPASGTVINNNILNGAIPRRASTRREPIEQLRQRMEKLKAANNIQQIEAEVVDKDEQFRNN